ncbi:hypothetical protein T05_7323 [Trichinella murrelli]|uniref:Uncharacterized protein n=1 Tax=Trichinella murrelli TaxID=144512 RepID=A0A0V0UAL6_9BILA|nr:hypothetical protein T05_7323 [Trichinella murrelli]
MWEVANYAYFIIYKLNRPMSHWLPLRCFPFANINRKFHCLIGCQYDAFYSSTSTGNFIVSLAVTMTHSIRCHQKQISLVHRLPLDRIPLISIICKFHSPTSY